MYYYGWIVSFIDKESGERKWEGSFNVLDDAIATARRLISEEHKYVQVLQLVHNSSIQIVSST